MPGRRGGAQLAHEQPAAGEARFERIFIQPVASDAGNALGAALRVWRQRLGRPRGQAMTHAFYGADWSERERAEGLTGQGWRPPSSQRIHLTFVAVIVGHWA